MTSDPTFPERVGRYTLLAPIGSGGLANVYLGRADGIGGFSRQVAVKILHPHLREQRELVEQLIQEARVVGQIHHPNVVQVMDVGEDVPGVFIVMEYVEGEALAWLLKTARESSQPLPRAVALKVMADALEGLHAAHEAADETGTPLGIVHRDFSPQNLMVGTDGVTRLIDFGVAKLARSGVQTQTGLIKGKVAYMSPEQTRGQAVDARCDVWAAGVVVWETFAGRRLFKRGDDLSTMLEIASGEVADLGAEPTSPPEGAVAAARLALRRDVDARCDSARELRRLLLSGPDAVASSEEVAEYVRAIAAPRLAERRERIDKVVVLRDESRASGDAAGLATPAGGAGSAKPAPEHTDTRHSLSQPTRIVAARPGRKGWLVLAGLSAAAAAVLLLAPWADSGDASPAAASVARPLQAAPSQQPVVAETKRVEIAASEPMASLTVAGRAVALQVAANLVEVRVPVATKQLVIQAATSDGRTTSYVGEGVPDRVRLDFGAAKPASEADPVPTRPAVRVKPGRTSDGARKPEPLSPSPYRKGP